MSSLDDLARILAERDLDVGDLIREAEEDARADVAETLRRLFADDLLRRVGEHVGRRQLVALAGVADGVRPLVLELRPGDLDNEARLEQLVRSHNELLLGALEQGAVVPFRFGTTFPDHAALEAWLERHRTALASELERLRGTAEWSVEPVGTVPDVGAAEYLEARLATTVRPGLRERPLCFPRAEAVEWPSACCQRGRPLSRLLVADELVVQLVHTLVQREEGRAELFRLVVAEAAGRHAAYSLPLEQLAEDLDQHKDELGQPALKRVLVRLDTRRQGRGGARTPALAARKGEVVGAFGADRSEQRLQPQRDEVDAGDRDRHVARGGDSRVDERVEQVDEAVAHGRRANEYGGHGPVTRSS